MNTCDININQYILRELIDRALLDTIVWITKKCKPQKPQEPDYVAALSTKFVEDFFNVLVAVFPNYNFSVVGVYCHQKPIVDIKQPKNPELGDILFVYVDRKQEGKMVLNSLLLQAKISSNPWLRVHGSERHQLELYKNWPQFTYCSRAGNLNKKERNILPKTINDGAQYLLINDKLLTKRLCFRKRMFSMGCAIPDDILYINNSLSDELIDLLKFKSGRTFDSNHSTKDEWSKMIWDLLQIAAFKYSKRKNAQLDSFPRINGCSHFCTKDMEDRALLNELLDGNLEEISDKDGGVSVVLVESQLRSEYEE